jgi:hypothetical protein
MVESNKGGNMINNKAVLIILCSIIFTVGCSSNDINDDAPPLVTPPIKESTTTEPSNEDTPDLVISEIESDEAKISQDVTLSVSISEGRKLSVTFANNSSNDIDHGYAIYLEKKIDGIWYGIPEKAAYADESLILEPENEFTQNGELDNWDETTTGIFRMYKRYSTDSNRPFYETEKFSISNEFEVRE